MAFATMYTLCINQIVPISQTLGMVNGHARAFIHSFNADLLNAYYAPSSVKGLLDSIT